MLEKHQCEEITTGVDIFQCDRLRRADAHLVSILESLEKNLLIMEECILIHKRITAPYRGDESIGPWEKI